MFIVSFLEKKRLGKANAGLIEFSFYICTVYIYECVRVCVCGM